MATSTTQPENEMNARNLTRNLTARRNYIGLDRLSSTKFDAARNQVTVYVSRGGFGVARKLTD